MKNFVYKMGSLAIALLLLGLAWAGVAHADGGGGEEHVQIANGYQVVLVLTRPAQVGANPVQVRLSDAHGQPVAHATVAVSLMAGESGHTDTGHEASGHAETEASADTHTETDAHNAAEAHTEVETHSETDAHSATEALTLLTEATHGEYAGEIGLPQAGAWVVRVHLTIDEAPLLVDFPVTVASPQNGLGILAGFLTVNVGILGLAAVLRARKPTQAPHP